MSIVLIVGVFIRSGCNLLVMSCMPGCDVTFRRSAPRLMSLLVSGSSIQLVVSAIASELQGLDVRSSLCLSDLFTQLALGLPSVDSLIIRIIKIVRMSQCVN